MQEGKDEAAKTAYKLLVAMNEKFNGALLRVEHSCGSTAVADLTGCMSETVGTRNAILELERKITAVKLRTDTLDLNQVRCGATGDLHTSSHRSQVRADLEALRAENTQMAVRVAALPPLDKAE